MSKTLKKLALTGLVVLAAVACGGRDDAKKQDPNYETVQEGQAAGVTSTIHGPGETVPPMTGTNADTTSAFTINPALATAPATPPGTLAGTLPSQPYGGTVSPGYVPRTAPSAQQQAQPAITQPTSEPQRDNTTSTAMNPATTTTTAEPVPTTSNPAPPTEPAPPPPTQTHTDAPPPEKSDTTQTDTAPPPPPPPPPA